MNLNDICMIIDCDGFFINNTFHTREYGYASLTKETNNSFRFDLSPLVQKMTPKDWKNAIYCKYNIHGLSFRPRPDERDLLDEKLLNKTILQNYKQHETFDKKVIAYKGGNIERNILKELNIPSLDLEKFGCPKYNNLPLPNIKDCGYHIISDYVHCPKKECYAFAKWVKEVTKHERLWLSKISDYYPKKNVTYFQNG